MSYVAVLDLVGRTMFEYRRLRLECTASPVDGLVVQVAGMTDDGVRITSVWDSQGDHDRFLTERLYPSFDRLGPPDDMRFTDLAAEEVLLGSVLANGPVPSQLLAGAPDATNRMYAKVVGYWSSQIAGAMARLDIPDLLAAEPLSSDELSSR